MKYFTALITLFFCSLNLMQANAQQQEASGSHTDNSHYSAPVEMYLNRVHEKNKLTIRGMEAKLSNVCVKSIVDVNPASSSNAEVICSRSIGSVYEGHMNELNNLIDQLFLKHVSPEDLEVILNATSHGQDTAQLPEQKKLDAFFSSREMNIQIPNWLLQTYSAYVIPAVRADLVSAGMNVPQDYQQVVSQ